MEALIKKCQNYNIDPFGYGFYARAYQYPLYKEAQTDWGKNYPEHILMWKLIFESAPLEQ
ncbi:Ger(x)C family spore germination C-terminal domain-containing protein [Paenibacillus sp. OVF10]|nr:Ger(x)C family spore germination C-terminal domain-containing protein [Paenibacillus sp. OVF10]